MNCDQFQIKFNLVVFFTFGGIIDSNGNLELTNLLPNKSTYSQNLHVPIRHDIIHTDGIVPKNLYTNNIFIFN